VLLYESVLADETKGKKDEVNEKKKMGRSPTTSTRPCAGGREKKIGGSRSTWHGRATSSRRTFDNEKKKKRTSTCDAYKKRENLTKSGEGGGREKGGRIKMDGLLTPLDHAREEGKQVTPLTSNALIGRGGEKNASRGEKKDTPMVSLCGPGLVLQERGRDAGVTLSPLQPPSKSKGKDMIFKNLGVERSACWREEGRRERTYSPPYKIRRRGTCVEKKKKDQVWVDARDLSLSSPRKERKRGFDCFQKLSTISREKKKEQNPSRGGGTRSPGHISIQQEGKEKKVGTVLDFLIDPREREKESGKRERRIYVNPEKGRKGRSA